MTIWAFNALIERLLRAHGSVVKAAASGLEALDVLEQSEKLDIVLLDVSMPEMDGIEVYRRIRSIRETLPIVLMSGQTSQALPDEMTPDNLVVFIQKPFSIRELRETFRLVVAQSKQSDG